MSKKIVRFPISASQRWKNSFGKLGVPCMVSGRWLQFPEKSVGHFGAGEFVKLDVMTSDSNDKPRKLCELIVTREDLLRVIDSIESEDS